MPREPLPGWAGEEVWNIVEGELEMTVGGATAVLRAGEAAVVPSGVEHSARAVGPCRAIVVDYPTRDTVAGLDIR